MTPSNFPGRALEAAYTIVDVADTKTLNVDKNFGVIRLITAGTETRTLARPTKLGIVLTMNMVTYVGDCVVTVTGGYQESGSTTITFNSAGDFIILQSVEDGAGTFVWRKIASDGVTGPTDTAGSLTLSGTLGVTGVTTPTGGIAAAAGSSVGANACQIHTGGYPAIASTSGTEVTPSATTTAYITEIFIPCNMTVTGVMHFNGSAVTGNVTVGLYTAAGVAIAAALSAATAGSGTDAYQAIPFATPYAAIGPAKYLIAFLYSSASARPNAHLFGTVFSLTQATFTVGTTAISPVPTAFTATTAIMASLY